MVCFLFFYNERVPIQLEHFAIYMSKSATVSSPIVFCLLEKDARKYMSRNLSAIVSRRGSRPDVITRRGSYPDTETLQLQKFGEERRGECVGVSKL